MEWTVNPQYAYGWSVPPLCGWLLYRAWRRNRERTDRQEMARRNVPYRTRCLPAILALGYGLTRVVEEANPDWRLVSWLLALEVLGLSIWAWHHLLGIRGGTFAWLFFLTAVPWPTPIEAPVVSELTSAVAKAATELLNLSGFPSLSQGNFIQTTAGIAELGPGCSGIRSLQVSLMLAFFFGEYFQLSLFRRTLCGLIALLLSLLLNLGRTVALALCLGAGAKFTACHDLAGICLPMASFLLLWWAARALPTPPEPCQSSRARTQQPKTAPVKLLKHVGSPFAIGCGLLVWILFVEIATIGWYRFHEQTLPALKAWRVHLDPLPPSCRQLGFSPETRRILRFDEGLNLAWEEVDQSRWQMIFLQWAPGRTAARLAHNHTPSDCLIAAGAELISQSEIQLIPVAGLWLPFRSYAARTQSGPVQIFYCLWEDRAAGSSFAGGWLTWRTRVDSVLAGRRNRGQRVLELARWGGGESADAAVRELLPKIIRVPP